VVERHERERAEDSEHRVDDDAVTDRRSFLKAGVGLGLATGAALAASGAAAESPKPEPKPAREGDRRFELSPALESQPLQQGAGLQPLSQGPATILKGKDGSLYLIPHAELEKYKIPADRAEAIKRGLDQGELDRESFRGPKVRELGISTAVSTGVFVVD
jgi:hypothetical protein